MYKRYEENPSMYIVQRGTIRTEPAKSGSEINKVIEFDYMGAAEYEFGAMPSSFRRIMEDFENYQFATLEDPEFTTVDGVHPVVFCHKDELEIVKKMLLDYIKDNDPKQIARHHLHERIAFHEHFYEFYKNYRWKGRDNFWWDFEHDIMFFIGSDKDRKMIENAMSKDYEEWWSVMEANRKSKLLKEAFSGIQRFRPLSQAHDIRDKCIP